jgi:hypothetical protein
MTAFSGAGVRCGHPEQSAGSQLLSAGEWGFQPPSAVPREARQWLDWKIEN